MCRVISDLCRASPDKMAFTRLFDWCCGAWSIVNVMFLDNFCSFLFWVWENTKLHNGLKRFLCFLLERPVPLRLIDANRKCAEISNKWDCSGFIEPLKSRTVYWNVPQIRWPLIICGAMLSWGISVNDAFH